MAVSSHVVKILVANLLFITLLQGYKYDLPVQREQLIKWFFTSKIHYYIHIIKTKQNSSDI